MCRPLLHLHYELKLNTRGQLTCRKIFQLSLFWCVTAVRP